MGEKRNKNAGRIVAVVLLFLFLKTSAAFLQSAKPEPKLPDLIPYRKGSKWGFCDKNKKIVIEPRYDKVNFFDHELAFVQLDKKYGFINSKGKGIIPIIYDEARFLGEFVLVKSKSKYGFFNREGREVVPVIYDAVFQANEGLFALKSNGKWGFSNNEGKIIIPFKFDSVGKFEEGLSAVGFNVKYGKNGEFLSGSFGYMNNKGEIVIPAKFEAAWPFYGDRAEIMRKGKVGFIDKSGKEIVAAKYEEAGGFGGDFAPVKRNGKWGFVDKDGNEIMPIKYDAISSFYENLYMARLRNKIGFLNETGEVIIPIRYLTARRFGDNLIKVNLGGQFKPRGMGADIVGGEWIYFDKTGKEVHPPMCKGIPVEFLKQFGKVHLGKKFGIVNRSCKEVVPSVYDALNFFSEGLASVSLGVCYVTVGCIVRPVGQCKWGFVDMQGRVVIPLKYDSAGDFHNGLASVSINGKWGYIDANGVEYFDDGIVGKISSKASYYWWNLQRLIHRN